MYAMRPTKEAIDPPRKRRPKGSGSYPLIPVRVSPELVAAIDKVARKLGISRSECVRQWIMEGLKRRPQAKPKA